MSTIGSSQRRDTMRRTFAPLLMVFSIGASGAQSATGPGERAGAAMTVDARTGALILFGGFTQRDGREVQLADTWRWRNGCWQPLDSGGPAARSWATLTYDPVSRAAILFGGKIDNSEEGTFGDTWKLTRDRWERVETARSPPARAHHAAAWDAAAERLVLFGGSQGFDTLGDTWIWSEGQWSAIDDGSGPHARALHAMYFDPRQRGVVVHGGSSNPWPPFNLADRWVLRGNGFQVLPSGPPRAYHVAGVLGESTMVSMGWGFEANAVVASWVEEEGVWKRLQDQEDGPAARAGASFAVDTSGALYLYGGMNTDSEPLGDLWRFDGAEWSPVDSCGR